MDALSWKERIVYWSPVILFALGVTAAVALSGCGGGDANALPLSPVATQPGPVTVGPAWLTGLDNNQVGWTGCVSYEPGRHGGGCFIQFQENNIAGKMMSGVTFNGGLVDATPGREQGDLDIVILVDGKPVVVAITGAWGANPAGLMVSDSDVLSIGGPQSRWKSAYFTEHVCPPTVPVGAAACVTINGGSVPIYR